jgi:hypothetical protein
MHGSSTPGRHTGTSPGWVGTGTLRTAGDDLSLQRPTPDDPDLRERGRGGRRSGGVARQEEGRRRCGARDHLLVTGVEPASEILDDLRVVPNPRGTC